MAEQKYDSVLIAQCKKQFTARNWELPGSCNALDTAAIAVRTILEMAGETELLANTPDAIEERKAMVAAVLPIMEAGAPVNFRRTALVNMGIAPKSESKTGGIDRPV